MLASEEWLRRTFENAKAWSRSAEQLADAGHERQAFVLATYAGEELAKAFLIWWALYEPAMDRAYAKLLHRHGVKQGLAFLLATADLSPDFADAVAALMADPGGYLLANQDKEWDAQRQTAIYEQEMPVRDREAAWNLGFALSVSLTLEDRLSRLFERTAGLARFDPDVAVAAFTGAFEEELGLWGRVQAAIAKWLVGPDEGSGQESEP